MAKKTSANMGLYLVKPEVKPGVIWPSIPKDAKPSESQYAYFARKYMAAQAARFALEKKTGDRPLDQVIVGVEIDGSIHNVDSSCLSQTDHGAY